MTLLTRSPIRVADEVWVCTALLHRENPRQADFSIEDIVERVGKEALEGRTRPGVYVHVVQHCVANRPPNPGRYRMLFETGAGRRRLYRRGDPYHQDREGSKITPNAEDLPAEHRGLLDWYKDWCAERRIAEPATDPLLLVAGSGKGLWADEQADDYVRRLREGWE